MSTPQTPAADEQDHATPIIADYMRRVDAGENVDRVQFVKEHPEVATELDRFLDNVALVEQMAGPTIAEQPQSADDVSPSERARRETVSGTQSDDSVPEQKGSAAGSLTSGKFGRYQVEKTLGEGAMGTVYLARDSELDRRVALKVPKFDDGDKEMTERFYREARAAAKLRHRNICAVHDIGEIDGTRYISMAYIAGRPLSDYVNPEQPPSERNVAVIIRKLALALDVAHREGVIHRDLKPANIMVDKKTEPVIMDFGLARQINNDENERLTQTGTVMGSPAYMSPEQVNADIDRIGPSSDIYSLGVILYELLTGQLPYEGSIAAVIGQILFVEPDKPSVFRPDLDSRLESICIKMMAKQIEDRHATMKEVAQALTKFLKHTGKADGPRPVGPAESFKPVELNSVVRQTAAAPRKSTKGRRTVARRRAEDQPVETFVTPSQASGGRKPPVASKRSSAVDRLQNIPGWAWGIAGAFGALLLVWGVVLLVQTPYGTLRLEVNDANLKVEVDDKKITFTDQLSQQLRMKTGPHRLAVMIGEQKLIVGKTTTVWLNGEDRRVTLSVAGIELSDDEFTFTRGGNEALKISVDFKSVAKTDTVSGGSDAPGGTTAGLSDPTTSPPGAAKSSANSQWTITEAGRMEGHTDPIHFMAISPDGRQLLSIPGTAERRLWNLKTNQHLPISVPNHHNAIFLSSSEILSTASTLRKFDLAGQKTLWSTPVPTSSHAVAVTPDRTIALVGNFTNPFVYAFDLETGVQLRKVDIGNMVNAIAVHPEGKRAWIGSENEIVVLDLKTWKVTERLKGLPGWNWALDFSAYGTRCAAAGMGNTIWLWDVGTRKVIRKFEAHTGGLLALSFLPGDQQIISGSGDKSLRLWDVASGEQLAVVSAPTHRFNLLAITPDGKYVYSAGGKHFDNDTGKHIRENDYTIYKWRIRKPGDRSEPQSRGVSPRTGSTRAGSAPLARTPLPDGPPGEVKTLEGHTAPITSVAFSPDGKQVASGSHDHTARIWDVQTGRELHTLKGHTGFVQSVAFSPDGRTVASGSWDKTVKIWDTQTGRELHTLTGHTDNVMGVAFSPDGRTLASGSHDKTVKIWDVESGRELRTLTGHADKVRNLTFGPDGKRLASVGWGYQSLRTWDVRTGKLLDLSVGQNIVTFDPDGKRLASRASADTLRIWDTETGQSLSTFKGHIHNVDSVVFSPDGNFLLTGSQDATLRIWNTQTGAEVHRFTTKTNTHATRFVSLSPDGQFAVSGGGGYIDRQQKKIVHDGDYALHLWRLPKEVWPQSRSVSPQTGSAVAHGSAVDRNLLADGPPGEVGRLSGHTDGLLDVAFTPDGASFLSSAWDATIRQWDLATGAEGKRFETPDDGKLGAMSLQISQSGRYFVAGFYKGLVQLYDMKKSQPVRSFENTARDGNFFSVAISPDESRIAGICADGKTYLWNATTGKEIAQYPHAGTFGGGLTFFPNGQLLVAHFSGETHTRIYDGRSGKQLREFKQIVNGSKHPGVSTDGRQLLTVRSNVAQLWSTRTGKLIRQFLGAGDSGVNNAVAILPGGWHVLASRDPKILQIWNIQSGKEIHRFTSPTMSFLHIAVSPDGRFLVTGGGARWDGKLKKSVRDDDYDLHVWRLPQAVWPRQANAGNGVDPSTVSTKSPAENPPGNDPASSASATPLKTVDEFAAHMYPVRFSRDGRFVLGFTVGDRKLAIYDVGAGKQVRVVDRGWGSPEVGGWASALAVSPVASLAAGGSSKGRLLLWDYETGKLIRELKGHTKIVNEVAFTPDGKWLLSSSADGTICTWSIATGTRLRRIFDKTLGRAMTLSPDGQSAAVSFDGKLSFHNVKTKQLFWEKTGAAKSQVAKCAFSKDGKRLAAITTTISRSKYVTIYDASDGRFIRKITGFPASLAEPQCLRFLADDRWLLSVHHQHKGGKSATLIWDTATGQLLQQIDDTHSADVSRDGSTVVTVGPKDRLRIWRLEKEKQAPSASDPVKKLTIAEALKKPITVDFKRTPLQDAVREIGKQAGVEIRIDGDALKSKGYTMNMTQTLSMKDKPASDVIDTIVKKYKGMVWRIEKDHLSITVEKPKPQPAAPVTQTGGKK